MVYSWLKLHYLAAMQDRLIFKPSHKRILELQDPEQYGLKNTESVHIKTSDQLTLHGWLHLRPNMPLVFIYHGNKGHFGDVGKPRRNESFDRAYRILLLKTLQEAGFSFFAVTMRGYGASSRVKPSEAGFSRDTEAVARYIKQQPNAPAATEWIILGESLGASVAMIMADQMTQSGTPPAMIVSIAAFHSIVAKVRDQHPDLAEERVLAKLRHRFHTAEHMKRLSGETRILLLAPELDDVTPKHHSERLAEIAEDAGLNYRYIELREAGHITWKPDDIVREINAYLPK